MVLSLLCPFFFFVNNLSGSAFEFCKISKMFAREFQTLTCQYQCINVHLGHCIQMCLFIIKSNCDKLLSEHEQKSQNSIEKSF